MGGGGILPRPGVRLSVSWKLSLPSQPREDLRQALDAERVSNGGTVPDTVANMIAAEIGTLDPGIANAKVTARGHLGSGSPRFLQLSVEGTK